MEWKKFGLLIVGAVTDESKTFFKVKVLILVFLNN
jgi:hypothetical protein